MNAMSPETTTYVTILGMAVATYLTRVLGLALATRCNVTGRGEALLKALPGAILTAIIAPALASAGPVEWVGAAVTLFVALRLRNLPLAMLAGVVCVWAGRMIVA